MSWSTMRMRSSTPVFASITPRRAGFSLASVAGRVAEGALHVAAALDRADAVSFVLDLGVPVNVRESDRCGNQVALHDGRVDGRAQCDSGSRFDRGGDVDRRRREPRWDAARLCHLWAVSASAIHVLSAMATTCGTSRSSDRRPAARCSRRASIARASRLAGREITALMRLPGDPAVALDVAKVLVDHGADPVIATPTASPRSTSPNIAALSK